VRKTRFVVCALVWFATSAFAASYIVPTDRDIVNIAKAIVIATGMSSYSVAGERTINTVYQVRVDEVIKGRFEVGAVIDVVAPGGCLGTRCVDYPGTPKYAAGERALVFLDSVEQGRWSTWSQALGKFNFVKDLHGKAYLVRGGDDGEIFGWDVLGNAHVEPLRDEQQFLTYIRALTCDGDANENYIVPRDKVTFPRRVRADANSQGFHASDYVFTQGRWKCIFDQPAGSMAGCGGNASVTYTLYGTATGVNGSSAASAGMSAWNGDSLSNVSLVVGGSVAAAPWNRNDAASSIHFDDDADVTAGCGASAVGCGGNTYDTSDSYTFDGSTFFGAVGGDVAIKTGFTTNQTLYNQVVCHEIGHTLGLRHSDQGSPSSNTAVMISSVDTGHGALGAVLQTWDHDAVSTVYNPSPAGACTAPSITGQPQSQTITSGQQANLSVTASGSATLTYQWYIGNPPSTTTPAGSGQTIHPSPTTTTTYWVRVSNSCGTADSNAATVTVNPATCTPPSISTQPQSQAIVSGNQANLSVGAAGTGPFSYQWYVGNPPTTSTPAGSTQSINPSPTQTTNYWVRITGQCGTPADSNAATVTVSSGCSTPFIVNDPPDQQITSGSSTSIFVGYSGTTSTVTWYRGAAPDQSNPVFVGQSFITGPLTQTTQFWARVSNNCGSANSRTVTIVVTSACVPPAITLADAAPKNVAPGATVTLTAQATGTGLQYQWYRGVAPDFSNPVPNGTTSTATDAPQASTSYFVHVSNTCGSADSASIAVTVSTTPSCTPPSITGISDDMTVSSNQSATLVVAAVGDPTLHYQWFQGPSGVTGIPVGTDSPTFVTPSLFSDAEYWVRVASSCAPTANSRTVKVSVIPAKRRAARH
jgi:Ig-like domain CHU_C associated/Matrixin